MAAPSRPAMAVASPRGGAVHASSVSARIFVSHPMSSSFIVMVGGWVTRGTGGAALDDRLGLLPVGALRRNAISKGLKSKYTSPSASRAMQRNMPGTFAPASAATPTPTPTAMSATPPAPMIDTIEPNLLQETLVDEFERLHGDAGGGHGVELRTVPPAREDVVQAPGHQLHALGAEQ